LVANPWIIIRIPSETIHCKVNFSTGSNTRTVYYIPVRLTSTLEVTWELKCTSCYIVLIYVKLVAVSVHKECRIVPKFARWLMALMRTIGNISKKNLVPKIASLQVCQSNIH